MTEREELREEIRTLEAERAKCEAERKGLMDDEGVLNDAYWFCPDGPAAKLIDELLDGILDRLDANGTRLDAISDAVGLAQRRLNEIEAPVSRRERIADVAYGRMP